MTIKVKRYMVNTKKGSADLKEASNGTLVLYTDIERLIKNAMTAVKQAKASEEKALNLSETRLRNARKSHVTEEDLQALRDWYDNLKTKPKGFPVEIFDSFGGLFDLSEGGLEDEDI